MSFLDDLKKQAGNLQAQQDDGQRSVARNGQLVEAAARLLRDYLMELAANLDVIHPAPKLRYALDRRVVLEGLPRTEFRFDARRKILRDVDVLDYIIMAAVVRGPRAVQVAKDFINEMEGLERRLEQAAILYEREPIRHADNGRLIEVRYAYDADVQVALRVTCEHDRGTLHFSLRNFDGLETVECELPAHLVNQSRLDELARWWVGEPNRFLDGAIGVRRVEAR